MSNESSLAQLERDAGGVFVPDQSGALGAAHFGDPGREYLAARTGAAVFDLSERTQVELTGRDRQKFLHNFCTNEIRGLQPGQGCEAFVANVQGKVLAHVCVFVTPHSLWIDCVPGYEQRLIAHLSRYAITDDVEFHGRSAEWGELFVTGAAAGQKLQTLGVESESLLPYGHRPATGLGEDAFVRRADFTGQPGYLLFAPRPKLTEIWSRLVGAGVHLAGMQAFHALRIEAGYPFYGLDMTENNLAQEVARNEEAICFTKGCYLGQEPIARIDALGHVNQELRGIRMEAGPLPQPGTIVLLRKDDRDIGRLTSSAISAADDVPVALAYIKRNHMSSGTEVLLHYEGHELPGVIFWR